MFDKLPDSMQDIILYSKILLWSTEDTKQF